MNNYKELSEDEIKLSAISSLEQCINDDEAMKTLTTKRHAIIAGIEEGKLYSCSFGFNDNETFLKLIFKQSEATVNTKNMFAVGNIKTGDLKVCFLPSELEEDNKIISYIWSNLDSIMTYYTEFPCTVEEAANKVNALANMLQNSLTTKKMK